MVFDKRTIKRDICLILAFVVLGLVLLFATRGTSKDGSFAVVEVDGKVVASYPLSQDGVFEVNGGSNTIEIQSGRVRMLDADCPNGECVHQGWISGSNQSIVCLPNRVVITVSGGEKSVDFIL